MVGISLSMETTCGAMLRELQHIWSEIGESQADKDRKLSEIEKECLQVYRTKVDEASDMKARLHQSVAAKEAELSVLMASLGEHNPYSKADKRTASLKEQLALVTPLLEDLRKKKEERIRQFSEVRSQIEKIASEIKEFNQNNAASDPVAIEEHDLSIRKLNEYQAQLRTLQKEKSDRLQKVLAYINKVHSLCGVLGLDFQKTVDEVHPSLCDTSSGKSTNISNNTLEGLAQSVMKLKMEKEARLQKLRETVESLVDLWNLMGSSEEEKRSFIKLKYILGSPEEEIKYNGVLSKETIEQTEDEVERLKKLKASRMKELVLKKRLELEDICKRAHMEPDISTEPEKTSALIDSGLVDPSELLTNIEAQIVKVKEELMSRKDIMDRISKWLAACEEENWLEEYNQDENRYGYGRGAHLNLRRAEKARITVTKIPAIVDNLISRTCAWENERNTPFLYDGVHLVSILEECKLSRQQKEEERKRYRDQKKLQDILEKGSIYSIKPIPRRNGYYGNGKASGFMTPAPRRPSVGSATPELLTPRSYSGHRSGYFRETRRLSTPSLNYFSTSKADTSSSFASISGSDSETPPMADFKRKTLIMEA